MWKKNPIVVQVRTYYIEPSWEQRERAIAGCMMPIKSLHPIRLWFCDTYKYYTRGIGFFVLLAKLLYSPLKITSFFDGCGSYIGEETGKDSILVFLSEILIASSSLDRDHELRDVSCSSVLQF